MTTSPCDCVRLREQVRVMREALNNIATKKLEHSRIVDFKFYKIVPMCEAQEIAKQALNQKESK